tara:strand:+ start:83 stop:202 length:120 start_codon:yes stop_codon:yes gene_type:complete
MDVGRIWGREVFCGRCDPENTFGIGLGFGREDGFLEWTQ